MTIKHFVIPDTQIEPSDDLSFIDNIGMYLRDMIIAHPETRVIILADWWDMPSLSSYDEGKKAMEGLRLDDDIACGNEAMRRLWAPLMKWNRKRARLKKKQIWPMSVDFTEGNHEYRLMRYIEDFPKLEGVLGRHLFEFPVPTHYHRYLEVVERDGVLYSHFFPRGPRGHVTQSRRGAPSAHLQVSREHQSCTAGHQQGLQYAVLPANKRMLHGLIVGSCYPTDKTYLTPQGTEYWRGVVVKHDVHEGNYCPMFVDESEFHRQAEL